MSAPPTVRRKYLDAILDDFYSHLVPDEIHSVPVGDIWTYAPSCIQLFYQVSHPYKTSDAARAQPRVAHREILKKERIRDDHTTDLLSIY